MWLATGTEATADADRLTRALVADRPVELVGGWPVLDSDLRWPGAPVFVMGRLATLRLGPAAGNLWGARVGAEQVALASRRMAL